MRVSLLLSLVLLVAACGSTPEYRHYLLSADAARAPTGTEPAIGVGPVTVPEYLDRKELVRLQSRNRVQVLDFERWAEPLDKGISRVIAVNLAGLLDTQDVVSFPWRRDARPDFAVQISVARFHAGQGRVNLDVQWSVRDMNTDSVIVTHLNSYRAEVSGGDSEELVAAHSELLRQLSEDIAAALSSAE